MFGFDEHTSTDNAGNWHFSQSWRQLYMMTKINGKRNICHEVLHLCISLIRIQGFKYIIFTLKFMFSQFCSRLWRQWRQFSDVQSHHLAGIRTSSATTLHDNRVNIYEIILETQQEMQCHSCLLLCVQYSHYRHHHECETLKWMTHKWSTKHSYVTQC